MASLISWLLNFLRGLFKERVMGIASPEDEEDKITEAENRSYYDSRGRPVSRAIENNQSLDILRRDILDHINSVLNTYRLRLRVDSTLNTRPRGQLAPRPEDLQVREPRSRHRHRDHHSRGRRRGRLQDRENRPRMEFRGGSRTVFAQAATAGEHHHHQQQQHQHRRGGVGRMSHRRSRAEGDFHHRLLRQTQEGAAAAHEEVERALMMLRRWRTRNRRPGVPSWPLCNHDCSPARSV